MPRPGDGAGEPDAAAHLEKRDRAEVAASNQVRASDLPLTDAQ